MKSEGQIRQKVKQVIFRHRKEHVRQGLVKRPTNCRYNEEVRLPANMANRATIRVCGYHPAEYRNNVVCDSSMGGDPQATECPYFQPLHSPEDLKEEFNAKLGLNGTTVEIGVIAKEYPDIAALMWVMGPAKNVNTEEPDSSEENTILAFFGNGEEPEELPERPLVDDDES